MPENADEIALDTITLDKLGLAHQLGETVHLSWTIAPGSDAHETADFTLCGIWQGNPAAMASHGPGSQRILQKRSAPASIRTWRGNLAASSGSPCSTSISWMTAILPERRRKSSPIPA